MIGFIIVKKQSQQKEFTIKTCLHIFFVENDEQYSIKKKKLRIHVKSNMMYRKIGNEVISYIHIYIFFYKIYNVKIKGSLITYAGDKSL